MDSIPQKRCTGCGVDLPATEEYFHRYSKPKTGLRPQCRACAKAYNERTREHRKKRDAEYHQRNRERRIAQYRNYYQRNANNLIAKADEYYQRNKPLIARQHRVYRLLNRDKIREYMRAYHRSNPHMHKASYHRYRARKHSLPDTFQKRHWLLCLDYWHNTCAVCGSQLRDLFGNVEPHADHWHPLNQAGCPGTVPENMICLCGSCNSSKNDILPEQWLIDQYGKRKAQSILERIRKYFDWIKSQ